jgi:hypothetical protein
MLCNIDVLIQTYYFRGLYLESSDTNIHKLAYEAYM